MQNRFGDRLVCPSQQTSGLVCLIYTAHTLSAQGADSQRVIRGLRPSLPDVAEYDLLC
jgi:hypothetical protein